MSDNKKIPKIINMSYKSIPPSYIFDKWKELNPDYRIDFSLDEDCVKFLRDNYNDHFANLFESIDYGPYKCDFWRLCKLYIDGGVYADIDLVPFCSIDDIIKDKYDFYSSIAADRSSIFQAIIITIPRNPIVLGLIASFIMNKPYTNRAIINGPTYDMYNYISKLNKFPLKSNLLYKINTNYMTIPINIGKSKMHLKIFYNFFDIPENSTISIERNRFDEEFKISFNKKYIYIERIDKECGWDNDYTVYIKIKTGIENQELMFFQEQVPDWNNITNAYVTFNRKKIFGSRYSEYFFSKLNNTEWL